MDSSMQQSVPRLKRVCFRWIQNRNMDVGLVKDDTGVLRWETARKGQNKWDCAAGKRKKGTGTIWDGFDGQSNLDHARLEVKDSSCSKGK